MSTKIFKFVNIKQSSWARISTSCEVWSDIQSILGDSRKFQYFRKNRQTWPNKWPKAEPPDPIKLSIPESFKLIITRSFRDHRSCHFKCPRYRGTLALNIISAIRPKSLPERAHWRRCWRRVFRTTYSESADLRCCPKGPLNLDAGGECFASFSA